MPPLNLHWSIYNNPLVDNNVFRDLDPGRFEFTQASFQTLGSAGYGPGALAFANVSEGLMYDALSNWMFKRVTATDGAGYRAYEGYIAEVKAKVGNAAYEALCDNFSSRIRVKWTEADPLHPATRDVSSKVNDTASQAKFCIKEEELDLTGHGVIDRTQALQAANALLAQTTDPLGPSYDYKAQAMTPNSLELTLWGYYTTLDFQYDNTKTKQKTEIATILKNVLANGNVQYVSTTDTTNVQNVGVTIRYGTAGDWKKVGEIFQDLTKYGDASYRQLLLQVWEDRKLFFAARPIVSGFFARSDDPRVWSGAHAAELPWRVRAGQYLLVEDFPTPLSLFSDVDTDPRSLLIDATNYNDLTGDWNAKPVKRSSQEVFWGRVRRGVRTVRP